MILDKEVIVSDVVEVWRGEGAVDDFGFIWRGFTVFFAITGFRMGIGCMTSAISS